MRLAIPLVLLFACGGDGDGGVAVIMKASDVPPPYGTTPYPTDALREGDHLAVNGLGTLVGSHSDIVLNQINALDGFGVRPLVEFFVNGELDAATVPAHTTAVTDAAALVDVDPASPEHGRVIAMDWHYDAERHVVQGKPASGEVLLEGTRYAAFVTSDILTADGAALGRSSALDHLHSARWQTTTDALHELANDRIAGLAVFTTQHATAPLVAAAAVQAALPAPTLTFPDSKLVFAGTTALDKLMGRASRFTTGPRMGLEHWGNDDATGVAHDHVGVVATGQMTVTRFRRDDTGTDLADDETFEIVDGKPRVVATDTIPVTIILPSTPPPASGYPVVIYGHGLAAGRHQLMPFAEPLTSQGYALVGIDMSGHGSRFDPTDHYNNQAEGKPGFTGDPMMPDGFGDTTGPLTQISFFENFLGVGAIRDSIRQSALDLSSVTRLLRRPDLDLSAIGGAKLDTRHVTYLGESFGTVVGTLFAAIEPDIDLYVLDVPGGGIADLLLPGSPEIGAPALPIVETIYHPLLRVDRWNPLVGLMQSVLDGGDPLTYAPHVLRDRFGVGARSVICIEVVGDQVMSNKGTEALVRELGLAVLTPDLAPPSGMTEMAGPIQGNADGKTAVLVQYSPATHGANWQSEHGTLAYMPNFPYDGDDPFPKLPTPVTIRNPIYETWDQVFEILSTHQSGEAPRVRTTLAPIADFDDDGKPDATDPSPYDPSK
jgi:pimeloyl-ACP methyl ester carboxylesterase